MGMSIGHAKKKFAVIIEDLLQQPPLLSQFAVWLDMKLSEYKLQGGMRLDLHEVVSHPDWMQGVKCRCFMNVRSKLNVPESEFGHSAWMFPLVCEDPDVGKRQFQDLFVDDQRRKRRLSSPSQSFHERSTRVCQRRASGSTGCDDEKDSGTYVDDAIQSSPNLSVDNQCSLSDDRNIFNAASTGFYPKQSRVMKTSSGNMSGKSSETQSASTFLSNLVKASTSETERNPRKLQCMSLEDPDESALSDKDHGIDNPVSLDMDYIRDPNDNESDCGSEVGSNSNDVDVDDEDDDVVDMLEVEEGQMPKIISVTSVGPNAYLHEAYTEMSSLYKLMMPQLQQVSIDIAELVDPDSGQRRKTKPTWKVHHKMHLPQKKTRVVRNYSRDFKLTVVGHSLKLGPKSAVTQFEIPKSNVQRWTTRVVKSSPYIGLANTPGLFDNLMAAERGLAKWLRETYTDSGPITVSQLKEYALPLFQAVYPDFKPEYVWVLHFIAKYKLVKCVDIPIDTDEPGQLSTEEGNDMY